ncbi:MAG: antibiotic biosynthesis monooxygenase [Humidesulfovibrio sp.]|nr:antibiotic biosynthesis monooxygenase [Humidesulfovibrio sp.]
MIAREWKCLCPQETAAGFLDHLRTTGVDEAKVLPGYRGHQILTRRTGPAEVEFTLLTWWEAMDHVRTFVGAATDAEAGRAVLYPGDECYGIIPERHARHYEVLETVLK